jgi:hypothetical protein
MTGGGADVLLSRVAAARPAHEPEVALSKDSLTITDNRTGKAYETISRPRQIFLGAGRREYVPLHRRG